MPSAAPFCMGHAVLQDAPRQGARCRRNFGNAQALLDCVVMRLRWETEE